MRVASVQGGYMRDVGASLARLGAEGEAVRRADPELFRELAGVSRAAWLPIAYNLRWVEATERGLGWPRALEFLAERVHAQFDLPLFRGFIEGGVRLFGLDPGSLVRWLPRGMGLVFRGCGSWTTTRLGPHAVEIRGRALPPEVAGHARWIESIGAAAGAMFTLCRVSGEARLAEHDSVAGSACIAVEWAAQKRAKAG